MANLLVKGIEAGLLREVNYAAAGEELTQTQWVIKVLEKETGVGGKNGVMQDSGGKVRKAQIQGGGVQAVRGESKGDAPGDQEPEGKAAGTQEPSSFKQDERVLIPGEKCHCGAGLYEVRMEGGVKWKCVGRPVHTMSPRRREMRGEKKE